MDNFGGDIQPNLKNSGCWLLNPKGLLALIKRLFQSQNILIHSLRWDLHNLDAANSHYYRN